MRVPQQLHRLGQRLWLDDISREMLSDGKLDSYVSELSIRGITTNPSILERSIAPSDSYVGRKGMDAHQQGQTEKVLREIEVSVFAEAADRLRPIYDESDANDGWVSVEVSPQLANSATESVAAALALHKRIDRPNVLIKIPATRAGILTIGELVYRGVPVNATLLFSAEQYRAVAHAYIVAVERRIHAGLNPFVRSVASLFVSRWDVAANQFLDKSHRNRLGIAVADQTYQAYRQICDSRRWRKIASAGGRPQTLLWASTGTKDAALEETYYVRNLVTADTIITVPERTLRALGDSDVTALKPVLPSARAVAEMAQIRQSDIDIELLAEELQLHGVRAFTASWTRLLAALARKHKKSSDRRRSSA